MHGLWVELIQEIALVGAQAIILTATFLLHRAIKTVNAMLQEHIMQINQLLEQWNTIKRP